MLYFQALFGLISLPGNSLYNSLPQLFMSRTFAFLFAGMLLLSSGCATIMSKTTYPVRIMSMPDQAEVSIFNLSGRVVFTGQTPVTAILASSFGYFQKAVYRITISKEGYDPQSFTISASLNEWYLGNLAFGGLIGFLIVDPLTGAMYKLDTTLLEVELVLQSAINPGSENRELRVLNLNDIPESWKANLVRLN